MPDEPEKAESQKEPADSPGSNTGDNQRDISKPVTADTGKLVSESQAGKTSKDEGTASSSDKSKTPSGFPRITLIGDHQNLQLSPWQKRLADRAAELGLKPLELPFASVCVDGLPHEYWGEPGKPEVLVPSVATLSGQELTGRLNLMGKFWSHQGVLEFVDSEGRYHIARDIKSNIYALQEAGFEHSSQWTSFVNGITPSGEAKKQLEVIFRTPENENERLRWAVRDIETKAFDYALDHGADPSVVEPFQRRLLFDALDHSNSPERNEIIRKLLAKDSVIYSKDGVNAISAALASRHSTLDVMPDLLKVGHIRLDKHSLLITHNPFQRTKDSHRNGVPAFLQINPDKETAREELKLVVDDMLSYVDLSKAERQLIKAHHDVIDQALKEGASTGNQSKARTIIEKLAAVWEIADKFASAKREQISYNDCHIPQQVQEFLEPLTDAKRAPKLIQTLMAYDMSKLNGVRDLVHEFTMHVAIPQAILEHLKATGKPLSGASIREFCGHVQTEWLATALEPPVRRALFDGRSIDKIIGLNEAWHDPQVVFPDALKPLAATGEWHALTGQKEYVVPKTPDITIHVLTSDKELVSEGKSLEHCVGGGGYTTKCLQGKSHIFSVRKAGETIPLSTIEATWDGETFEIVQNRGVQNATPSNEAIYAGAWLKQQIESGAIGTSRASGETPESKKRSQDTPEALRAIGFEITQENINAAFAEYTQNNKRRAREYNPKTEKFDITSRRTELIAGTQNIKIVDEEGKIQNKGISLKDMPADQWFKASGVESGQQICGGHFDRAISKVDSLRPAVEPEVKPIAINTAEVPTNAEVKACNQQFKSPAIGDRLAKFFDNEFFTGGQRTGFSMAANTLGAKAGLEMLLQPNEYLSDAVRHVAGTTLLGSSAIGLRADYDVAHATRQLAQAEAAGNEINAILAKRSLESAQKLAHVTGATTTGLMLPLEAYQAGAAFSKGNYGEGSLYTAKTASSGLLLGSIGYSTAANAASKGAQVAQAAGLTEKAIELAGMAGKYTKVAKFLGPIGVGIAIGTETIDIGVKSYHIASAIGEIEEIRHSLIQAERYAFRPGANQEYLDAMKKSQNKKAYEIEDPKATEYKHLNLAGYGSLPPADIESRIETELKTLEQRKAELSMHFSDIRSVTTDDFGGITSESPSERELVQTPEGRVNLKMGNHGFGVGEAIMPSSYVKYDNAVSNVETVDNRIRILHAAKKELTGDSTGHINGNPHLFSYATRYEGVRQAREAYAKAVQEMEPHIAGFEASLVKSGSNVTDYLKSVNEQREQYDQLHLGDSQSYADAKKHADHFKQEYEKTPQDRLMYGLMLISQANLQVMLGKEVQSLQHYSQTPLEVKVTHVQTQKEATEGRDEMRRIQNIFSRTQPSRSEPVPNRQLMVTAEVTMDANHYRYFMKELSDAGLPVMSQGERDADGGKITYTIGFWKGHLQEYLVSQRPVGRDNDTATIALPSGKIIAFTTQSNAVPRQDRTLPVSKV